jgi:hypothetical protein
VILKLGGLAIALSAIITFGTWIWSRVHKHHPCTQSPHFGLADVKHIRGTFEQYLLQSSGISLDRPPSELAQRGLIFTYSLTANGYRGQPFTLRWTLIQGGSETIVSDPILNNRLALVITPDSCSFSSGQPIWVPDLHRAGSYYLEIAPYAPNGHALEPADSKRFTFTTS